MKVRFLQPKPVTATAELATRWNDMRSRIITAAISLALFLIPVRAMTIGYNSSALTDPFDQLPACVIGAVYDLTVVTVITGVALCAIWRWRERERVVHRITIGFAVLTVFMLIAGMANIEVVRMLGGPFNYRWLYYSDLFSTADGSHAILASMKWSTVLIGLLLCGAMLALAYGLRRLGPIISEYVQARTLYIATVPVLGFYLFFSHWYLITQRWDSNKLANPITAFMVSLVSSYDAPALMTMRTNIAPDDVRATADRNPSIVATGFARNPKSDVKNVLLFVMESVPAEYLETYGGKYPVTPTLKKYRDRSVMFKDVYAHAPATNMSLVSILCSTYPWISYMTLTQERPDVPLDSISAILKTRGNYRTAFFASGDLVYQGAGNFLSHRSFDVVEDYRDRLRKRGQISSFTSKWKFLNGTDDIMTADSMIQWLNSGDSNQPFFAMMWTLSTHYPYYYAEKLTDYQTPEETQTRYLNALRHGDEALGKLMAALEASGKLDSTLVVVIGDHGEAFGRHNQWGHGTRIYEENLKVPCILINPKLFRGEERIVVGGLVDVAPTILDVLGQTKLPDNWQGRSLFAEGRSNRVYFCAPWSDFLFGYRDGAKKLIYNATKNTFEVFDLSTDPTEAKNIANDESAFVRAGREYMAAWVQYQAKFYERAFRRQPAKPTGNSVTTTN